MAATAKGAQSTNEAPAAANTGGATQTPAADAQAGAAAAAGKTGDGGTGDAGKGGDQGTGGDGKGKGAQSAADTGTEQPGTGEAAASKAPEKYELVVPDDAKGFVSAGDLERLESIARANDWTQEEAAAELSDLIDSVKASRASTIEGWETATKADKDYGGKNLAETQRLGNLAIDRVYPKGHPEREAFLAFLKESGGGVRLEVVKFMANLGRMMGEDGNTGGRAPSGGGEGAAKFYDHPSSRALEEATSKG